MGGGSETAGTRQAKEEGQAMTRRRLLVFGLLTALTGLGVGAWALWPRQPSAITVDDRVFLPRDKPVEPATRNPGNPNRFSFGETHDAVSNGFTGGGGAFGSQATNEYLQALKGKRTTK
jgi:hypothetical protein